MDTTNINSSNRNLFQDIKSKNILKQIFDNLKENDRLKIIKYK